VGNRLNEARQIESEPMRRIKEIIENRYNEQLNIERLAKETFFSPTYVCLLFKEETGVTINGYLTEVRLNHAIRLLSDPDKKITDVSFDVGYPDPKYFSKLFKRREGCTPSEYRARLFQ
jgi:two-component system response regulator YesN